MEHGWSGTALRCAFLEQRVYKRPGSRSTLLGWFGRFASVGRRFSARRGAGTSATIALQKLIMPQPLNFGQN